MDLQVQKPVKIITVKDNGILIQGVLISSHIPKTKAKEAQTDNRGTTGGKPAKSFIRNSITFMPTNVDKLIQSWLDASPTERKNLPYVPVRRSIPTISIRYSSDMRDKVSGAKTYFKLPSNCPDFWIEQYVPKNASLFGILSLKPGHGLIQITSFCFAPSTPSEVGDNYNPTEDRDAKKFFRAKMPNGRISKFNFFASCQSVTPLITPLDNIPREFLMRAILFNPLYTEADLNKVAQTFMDPDTDSYKPLTYWLTLIKGFSSKFDPTVDTLYERCLRNFKTIPDIHSPGKQIEAPMGYIVPLNQVEYSDAGMLYSTSYFRSKDNGKTSYTEDDPNNYNYEDKKSPPEAGSSTHPMKNFANAQIRFLQWSNTLPLIDPENCVTESINDLGQKGQSGIFKLGLFDDSIMHCGITVGWDKLMASVPIPVSVVAKINVEKTCELEENRELSLRQENPLGIFQINHVISVWHMIDHCRHFGIPVTTAWIDKVLSNRERRTKFKPNLTAKSNNVVNELKGSHYGFINVSEFPEWNENKDEFYDPKNGWKFVVLVDFVYKSIADNEEDCRIFHSLSPADGSNVLDQQPLSNGRHLSIRGRYCGGDGTGGVIMGYRYDPEWNNMVQKTQETRIQSINVWRGFLANQEQSKVFDNSIKNYLNPNVNEKDKNLLDLWVMKDDSNSSANEDHDMLSAKGLIIFKKEGNHSEDSSSRSTLTTSESNTGSQSPKNNDNNNPSGDDGKRNTNNSSLPTKYPNSQDEDDEENSDDSGQNGNNFSIQVSSVISKSTIAGKRDAQTAQLKKESPSKKQKT